MMRLLIFTVVFTVCTCSETQQKTSPWTWVCTRENIPGAIIVDKDRCERKESALVQNGMSRDKCQLVCGDAAMLWPMPTTVQLSKETVHFLFSGLTLSYGQSLNAIVKSRMENIEKTFRRYVQILEPANPANLRSTNRESTTTNLPVNITVNMTQPETVALNITTDETYEFNITSKQDSIQIVINANNYFGARHALETLSQLIIYNQEQSNWEIISKAFIQDAPVYPIRSLSLDTARSFISVAGIKRTIDGMSYNKLNTLHWHITDTHSFPIEIPNLWNMSYYGAYSSDKVYSKQDVESLVKYAQMKGVRIIPELDVPAHVGYGWQWGEGAGLGKLVLCLNQDPWKQYCLEPPCGQLNMANPNIYEVIKRILKYYQTIFEPEILHFGGDEININCWNTSEEIRAYLEDANMSPDNDTYMELWKNFQKKSTAIWNNINGVKNPVMMWTSKLTELGPDESGLNPDQYILHLWTKGGDRRIGELLSQGYRIVLSNTDAWYLDCGNSAWVGKGQNWCSPYKSWQTVYDNSPRRIAQLAATNRSVPEDQYLKQVLGGSGALWTEQVDENTLDSRLWPRAAALAERLWGEPNSDSMAAQWRLVNHRERLVARGIGAERMQPQFCHEHEGRCYKIPKNMN